jgi:hypothetical protein
MEVHIYTASWEGRCSDSDVDTLKLSALRQANLDVDVQADVQVTLFELSMREEAETEDASNPVAANVRRLDKPNSINSIQIYEITGFPFLVVRSHEGAVAHREPLLPSSTVGSQTNFDTSTEFTAGMDCYNNFDISGATAK